MRLQRVASQFAGFVGAGFDRFADAIPERWRGALARLFLGKEKGDLVPLDSVSVYLADTDMLGQDVFELRDAARLQLHKHAPCDPDGLSWAVLPGSSDLSPAQLVFVRRADLDALAARHPGASGFVAEGESSCGVLRTGEQAARHRHLQLTSAGLGAALLLGLVIAAAGFADVQTRRLATYEAARSAHLAAASAARARLNDAETVLAALPQGPRLPESLAAIDDLARRRPEGWHGISIEIDSGTLAALFERDDEAEDAGAFEAGIGDAAPPYDVTEEVNQTRSTVRVSRVLDPGEERTP